MYITLISRVAIGTALPLVLVLVLIMHVFSEPCLAAPLTNGSTTQSQPPSFFGWKEVFYKFAPHTRREDLDQSFTTESGTDKTATYSAPAQGGITTSGREPSVTTSTPKTEAQAAANGQTVQHNIIQRASTEYKNPLLNEWDGPTHSDPFRHIVKHNPDPAGMNSQSLKDPPYLTGGTPASDYVQHALRLSAAQRTAEKILDPNLQSAEAAYLGAAQQTADATSKDASGSFDANVSTSSSPLINVANESAATPAQGNAKTRTISQAIWIVQQMYKRLFLPLSILLLLVGAVATQTTSYVKDSFVESDHHRPLEGILRSVIAIFLIGSIQLAVSYFIDFGNAMTDPVKQAVDTGEINSWSDQVTDSTRNMTAAEIETRNKSESTAASTTRAVFGSVQALLNTALMVLTVYQLVMVCYLFLLGPIAAALFAWPEGVGSLFRPVFPNWLNGLSNLVLWRFWWCVILLCMATRIQWLKELGSYNANSPWEPIVYTAFLVMLTYVPFAALDFKPGDLVDSLLEKASGGKKA